MNEDFLFTLPNIDFLSHTRCDGIISNIGCIHSCGKVFKFSFWVYLLLVFLGCGYESNSHFCFVVLLYLGVAGGGGEIFVENPKWNAESELLGERAI